MKRNKPEPEVSCWDYPSEPIGGGNPYHRCSSCGRSAPEINGRLSGHYDNCQWAEEKKKELNNVQN